MSISLTDQCFRTVELNDTPLRIISLVPSQTELLVDLGLQEKLVGVTRFCVHPVGLTDAIPVMGGTKKVVESRLYEAQPDLIICNKEENTAQIVALCDGIAPTYVSDIATLEDAIEMIEDLGKLTSSTFKAKAIARKIKISFNQLTVPAQKWSALYLIWKDPYMSVGNDTFIGSMLEKAGFENVMPTQSRYPEITMEQIAQLKPDVVFLSSEPYPFQEHDVNEFIESLEESKVRIVDGELFSWYGSRLLNSAAYYNEIRSSLS